MNKRILVLAMVGMLALMGAVQATSTMNPNITYTGHGIPDPSVGRVGDMYIDLNTSILYVMGTDSWGAFAVLPTPVNGTNGLNGATWIVGDTEPASEIGSNGDLYFDYATLDIYYKTNDVWTYLANIQGQTGPQGPQGEPGPAGTDGVNGTNGIDGKDGINGTDGRNGSIWYNELVANLTGDLGYDGDYYMFTNGTVYYKMNGTWVYYTSLMGPAGLQGETGETGPQGPVGADGINGTNGIDGINGANGIDGKNGINGTNGTDGTNGLNGQVGATGASGATGQQGPAGTDASVPWWLYLVAAVCLGASCYSVYKTRQKTQEKNEDYKEQVLVPVRS